MPFSPEIGVNEWLKSDRQLESFLRSDSCCIDEDPLTAPVGSNMLCDINLLVVISCNFKRVCSKQVIVGFVGQES